MPLREMLRVKIHNARLTKTFLHYEGSISIDKDILEALDILPGEKVHVLNLNNGERFTTYVIVGGKGEISLNGPAARLGYPGDTLLILSYSLVEEEILKDWKYKVAFLDEENRIIKIEERSVANTEG